MKNLRDQRLEYSGDRLPDTATEPWQIVDDWFAAAEAEVAEGRLAEASAMVVSTVDSHGFPSSRVVLLKEYDEQGFVFYTHYDSDKGRDIAGNDQVALLFWWPSLMRQIRIAGVADKVDDATSDEYFASRPRGSQLGAWASHQSRQRFGGADLAEAVAEQTARFEGAEVPRPEGWGGYRVSPQRFEFWQGQPSRLHDRLVLAREGDDWRSSRLDP